MSRFAWGFFKATSKKGNLIHKDNIKTEDDLKSEPQEMKRNSIIKALTNLKMTKNVLTSFHHKIEFPETLPPSKVTL